MSGCGEAAVSPERSGSLLGGPLPQIAEGGTVVCLASGPSLCAEDVDYVRGKAVVIAINDAIRLAPWADVVYSSDQIWWGNHYKSMRAFSGLKVRVNPSQHRVSLKPAPNGVCPGCYRRLPLNKDCWCEGIVTMRNAGERGLSLDPSAIVTGHNSGTSAINVAVHLGATRILLLGYDMGPDDRGRRHFYDTGATAISSPFYKFRQLTETMAEPLKAAGIAVLNCSRRTALDCFPCQPLREVLA